MKKLLENLAKSFNKDFEKIVELFEWAKNKLAAETGKKEPSLSVAALHAVRAKLTQAQSEIGKEINVIFFGKDPSRDTNASTREKILEEFWNNPESRKKVIDEGKIHCIKKKPLISIEEYVEVDGEFIPTKGELWDAATNINPICRDFRTHLGKEDDENAEGGGTENWQWSRPLYPNWKTTMFGLGFFEDTPDLTKKVQVRFFGDAGNPGSGQFVCKHLDFFRIYKMKVQLNETLSNDECYVVNARSKPILFEEPGEEIDVVQLIESVNGSFMLQQEAKGKEQKDLVPIIELADIKQWHLDRRVVKVIDKKTGKEKVLKRDSGWDVTHWDEYCVIDQVTYLGKREFKETYNPAVIQHDSTGEESHYVNYDEHLPMDIPTPADILICVKTGRGNTKYDRESRETIQDADDPDLRINICGYKTLINYEKIVFPKELTGDL